MSAEKSAAEANENSLVQVKGLGDANYYEALYQIIQDAQVAGSVVQIVTIWPPAQGGEGGTGVIKPLDCRPSGACPK